VVGAFRQAGPLLGIGGLKSRLRTSLETPVAVERTEATTKECFACGKRRELSLWDRVIECECGWKCDRDVNAALVILRKGLGLGVEQAVGLDRPELSLRRGRPLRGYWGAILHPRKLSSVKEEAHPLGVGGGHFVRY